MRLSLIVPAVVLFLTPLCQAEVCELGTRSKQIDDLLKSKISFEFEEVSLGRIADFFADIHEISLFVPSQVSGNFLSKIEVQDAVTLNALTLLALQTSSKLVVLPHSVLLAPQSVDCNELRKNFDTFVRMTADLNSDLILQLYFSSREQSIYFENMPKFEILRFIEAGAPFKIEYANEDIKKSLHEDFLGLINVRNIPIAESLYGILFDTKTHLVVSAHTLTIAQ